MWFKKNMFKKNCNQDILGSLEVWYIPTLSSSLLSAQIVCSPDQFRKNRGWFWVQDNKREEEEAARI